MAVVTQINFYPVKSMRPIILQEALATEDGLHHKNFIDRHYQVTLPNMTYQGIKQEPKLCLVQPSIRDGKMHLTAPGMETLSIEEDNAAKVITTRTTEGKIPALDVGEEAGEWISKYLGRSGFHVVRSSRDLDRRKFIEGFSYDYSNAKEHERIAFADACGYLLLSEESLTDLNSKLKQSVDMRRFRPNIVLTGCQEPFQEVHIPQLGCLLPTVDPDSATKDPAKEPLNTLLSYRSNVLPKPFEKDACFGCYFNVTHAGNIKVGDKVEVIS